MKRQMYYSGDPHWTEARYRVTCKRCHTEIKPGEQAFMYKDGSMYCDSERCGRQCEREFQCAAQDEYFA